MYWCVCGIIINIIEMIVMLIICNENMKAILVIINDNNEGNVRMCINIIINVIIMANVYVMTMIMMK